MKNIFLILIILITTIHLNGQSNYLYFSVSNNGQIQSEANDYYLSNAVYYYITKTDLSNTDLNLHFEHLFKNNIILGAKVGYSKLGKEYQISEAINSSCNQNIYKFSIFYKYCWVLNRIQLSTGLEIPFFLVDKFTSKYFDASGSQLRTMNRTIDGGNVFGINSVSSLKLFLTKKIYISTDISFGFLIFKLGGISKYYNIITDPSGTNIDKGQIESTYKKTTVSMPEFSLGFGLKF